MKLSLIATLTIFAKVAPVFAQDVANGEKEFRKCKSCHSIIAPDGTAIVKGGRVGPNLYDVIGRPVASEEGFNYRNGIRELGETGAVWTEEDIAEYMTDPSKFLKGKTGDPKAKSGMFWKQKKHQADIAAYLASAVVSPDNPANQ